MVKKPGQKLASFSVCVRFNLCLATFPDKYSEEEVDLPHSASARNPNSRMDTGLQSSISRLKVFVFPRGVDENSHNSPGLKETGLPTYPVRVLVCILCYPRIFHPMTFSYHPGKSGPRYQSDFPGFGLV